MRSLPRHAARSCRYTQLKTYIAQFGQLPTRVRRRVMLRAAAIFLSSVALATITAWDAHVTNRRASSANFNSITDKIVISIGEKMEAYEQVLRGGVSLFDAFGTVTRKQWALYVSGLKLAENYPGIQGVGYAAVIDFDKLDELERQVRNEGLTSFKVYPRDKTELNTTILFLEPLDWRNQRALGFDMFSEAVRRTAMERAWKTGRPALSGGVTLRQEAGSDVQRGVLLYLPVYARQPETNDAESARQRIQGFVYSPFRMRDLLSRVIERTDSYSPHLMRVEIFDGPMPNADSLLYDSAAASGAATPKSKSLYRQDRKLAVHGVTWDARLSSMPEFERVEASIVPLLTVVVGLVLGGLAAMLFGIVSMGREVAHVVASRLSAEVETRKVAEESTRVALRELAHRVKNTLTIVTAIASQTVRHCETLGEFDQKFRDRMLGMSRVHDLLTSGRTYTTDLAVLAQEVLRPYQGDSDGSISLDGPSVVLTPNTAIMLSMLFNELATNATKYGAWSNKMGRVALLWSIDEKNEGKVLKLSWQERDGPPVSPPSRQGFGSNVIKFSVERSLRGKADADFALEGVIYRIEIPWSEIDPQDVEV